MNPHTRWRVELAERVARAYQANPKVGAIAIAGSVALGLADRYSDIEIHVFWKEPPSDEDRTAAAERAGSRIDISWSVPPTTAERHRLVQEYGAEVGMLWPFEDDEWSELYFVDGVQCEISGFLEATVDSYLDDLRRASGVTDPKQMLVAAIQSCRPLHGVERLEAWRDRAVFSDALVRATVEQALQADRDWWAREALVDRDERVLFYEVIGRMQRKILRILLAINRMFLPDARLKWAGKLVSRMEHAPTDLAHRMKHVYEVPPGRSLQLMLEILEETWDLVEAKAPGVDPIHYNRWFRYCRPTWAGPRRIQE